MKSLAGGRGFPLRNSGTRVGNSSSNPAQDRSQLRDQQLRYAAGEIHQLGPRPLFEMLRELRDGRPLDEVIRAYTRIAPLAGFIREHRGDRSVFLFTQASL